MDIGIVQNCADPVPPDPANFIRCPHAAAQLIKQLSFNQAVLFSLPGFKDNQRKLVVAPLRPGTLPCQDSEEFFFSANSADTLFFLAPCGFIKPFQKIT
jgi:hypothetical protein